VLVQPDAASTRGALQLLDSMDAVISQQTMSQFNPPRELGSITPLPHSFLADLAAAQDTDTLQSILAPIGECCRLSSQ
jgi:hypothetical protein